MNALKRILSLILVLGTIFGMTILNGEITNVSARDYCVSEACKAASAAYEEATQKAEEAQAHADTLEGEIQRLQSEIVMMESKIAANKAIAEDLANQIAEQEALLAQQQSGFAEIYTEAYFDQEESELIKALKYKTFSERAEKEARDESIKAQISSSANTVKETAESLKMKKAQVEALIEDQEIQTANIAANKAKQSELKSKYEADASKYNEDAKAADAIKAEEMSKEIAKYNSIGRVVASGTNSYPYASSCPQQNWRYTGKVILAYGGAICECTGYAGYKAYERYGVTIGSWGDAKYWGISASSRGYRVDDKPEAGTVGYQTSGTWGHVVWIEAVNSDGSVNLSEYNNRYSSISGGPADFGYRVNVPASSFRYIHFR